MKVKKLKKVLLFGLLICLSLGLLGAALVLGINAYVVHTGGRTIVAPEKAAELTDMDCILVLGCQVLPSGKPSHMLEDRLKRAVELYKAGAAPKIIMSGDNGSAYYDEVNVMKSYAIAAGVPSKDIFMDHAGFSSYESVYRAQAIFGVKRMIVVTQKYHLYRALYIAKAFGIEAWGVDGAYRNYHGQLYRDVREILARDKDFIFSIVKPKPTYLGETIPLSGSGDVTNDKNSQLF